MQNYFKNEQSEKLVFESKLEVIRGGITIAAKELTQKRVFAGTPVGKDKNGLFHVIKTAKLKGDANATTKNYNVEKGSNFKVGDILSAKGVGYAITAIDESGGDYDKLTIGTTLGVELKTGDYLIEGDKAGASDVVSKYEPFALIGTTFDIIPSNNHLVDGVVRGTVVEKSYQGAYSDDVKKALPLIRFV